MNHMTRDGRDGMKDGQTLRSVTYMETVTEDINGEPMLTSDGKPLPPVTVERLGPEEPKA